MRSTSSRRMATSSTLTSRTACPDWRRDRGCQDGPLARTPSSAVAQRLNNVDGRLIRLDLGKAAGLSYYFVGGGLPIVVQDQLIGAIGVGGGNMDEQCAYQALTKVLGPQPPLPTPPAAGAAPEGRGRGRGQQ